MAALAADGYGQQKDSRIEIQASLTIAGFAGLAFAGYHVHKTVMRVREINSCIENRIRRDVPRSEELNKPLE